MPEGYTHVRTGRKALLLSRVFATDLTAFGAGTQGPDPLFFNLPFLKPKLPQYGVMMHRAHTGAFLTALVGEADTPLEKSYAMGFLTHYATDTNIHPFVEFLIGRGEPYDIPYGHGMFEIALDSALYKQDYGTAAVSVKRSTPTPMQDGLIEIAELLRRSIKKVYGDEFKNRALKNSFKHIRFARRSLASKHGVKRAALSGIGRLIGKENAVMSHITPAADLLKIPDCWFNPFENGKSYNGGIYALLDKSARDGADFIKLADCFWKRHITADEFRAAVGSRSYKTNLEDEISL